MKAWIEALRLRTLPLSAAGVIIAGGLAGFENGFRLRVFIPMLIMVLLLQIVSNFADEYGDLAKGADDENRIGPKRGMQRGDISKRQMKTALIVGICITFAFGLITLFCSFGAGNLTYYVVFLALAIVCLIAAVCYTVGNFAYGYHALGDLVCFLTFGVIAVTGGFFLHTLSLDVSVFIASCGLGLLVCGVLNLNNMRDIENDKATGKNTLVVRIGLDKARIYHCFLLVGGMALLSAFPLVNAVPFGAHYLFCLMFIPLIIQLVRTMKVTKHADYDSLMMPLSITTAALAIVFALCMAL